MPARANRLNVAHNSRAACALQLVGTLSNDDDGRQQQRQKTVGFMSKTTALHVHHAF